MSFLPLLIPCGRRRGGEAYPKVEMDQRANAIALDLRHRRRTTGLAIACQTSQRE